MNQQLPTTSRTRRVTVATSFGAALGAGGIAALLCFGGAVSALEPAAEASASPRPNADVHARPALHHLSRLLPADDGQPPPLNLDDLFGEDDGVFDGPLLTIPVNPDGPILTIPVNPDGPLVTIPNIPLDPGDDDDGPILTIPFNPDGPQLTIPNIPLDPGDGGTDPPADPPDAPTETTVAVQPPATTDAPQAPAGPDEVAPFLEITAATVDCAGIVHVSYDTGATPELAPENEHVVMFSPVSDPLAVIAHRLAPRAVNGTFTVDMESPGVDAYRVWVVADFEPANPAGVLLVDQADAAAPLDCPAPIPSS